LKKKYLDNKWATLYTPHIALILTELVAIFQLRGALVSRTEDVKKREERWKVKQAFVQGKSLLENTYVLFFGGLLLVF
jgi:hypothetical protein